VVKRGVKRVKMENFFGFLERDRGQKHYKKKNKNNNTVCDKPVTMPPPRFLHHSHYSQSL